MYCKFFGGKNSRGYPLKFFVIHLKVRRPVTYLTVCKSAQYKICKAEYEYIEIKYLYLFFIFLFLLLLSSSSSSSSLSLSLSLSLSFSLSLPLWLWLWLWLWLYVCRLSLCVCRIMITCLSSKCGFGAGLARRQSRKERKNARDNFWRWISWLTHRWRTQPAAISSVNCRIQWIIESLNANGALGFSQEHVCLSVGNHPSQGRACRADLRRWGVTAARTPLRPCPLKGRETRRGCGPSRSAPAEAKEYGQSFARWWSSRRACRRGERTKERIYLLDLRSGKATRWI